MFDQFPPKTKFSSVHTSPIGRVSMLFAKCNGRRPLLPLESSETKGHQKVAQGGARGQKPVVVEGRFSSRKFLGLTI
jgi:hypothetical protein